MTLRPPIPGLPAVPGAGRAALIVSVGALAATAWLTLWLSHGGGHGFRHTNHLAAPAGASLQGALTFVLSWAVMTVAMMLPTTLPVLVVFREAAGNRPDRARLLSLVVVGYLMVWIALGVLVYLGARGVVTGVSTIPWIAERSAYGGPALLILAGVFQLTPFKYRCLDKCRSPMGAVIRHWRGRHHHRQALKVGLDHGLYCVGCCWALMLLMFAVGTGSLVFMLALAALMAVEKNVSWGRRVAAPVGVVLVLWGSALLVGQ